MNKLKLRKFTVIISVAGMLIFLQACSSVERSQESAMNTSTQNIEQTTQSTEPASSPANIEYTPIDPELFAYDPAKPMNVQVVSESETETGVKVQAISFDVYDQSKNPEGKISCYQVIPKGDGPFPAVLYFHWLGQYNANKEEFLEEATALADKGIAGLLIDGYFPWNAKPSELEKDKSMVVYQVIELKRALDYISGLPNIDTKRIAYVGHDYGAMFGAVLSGIDKRISNYVLVAGMGNFSDWFLQYWVALDCTGTEQYRHGMKELDPENYVRNTAPAGIFFQFADNDVFISKDVADRFYEAASQPKEVKFYDDEHFMSIEEVRTDRDEWLLEKLK